jgi:hypothetical protein
MFPVRKSLRSHHFPRYELYAVILAVHSAVNAIGCEQAVRKAVEEVFSRVILASDFAAESQISDHMGEIFARNPGFLPRQ